MLKSLKAKATEFSEHRYTGYYITVIVQNNTGIPNQMKNNGRHVFSTVENLFHQQSPVCESTAFVPVWLFKGLQCVFDYICG